MWCGKLDLWIKLNLRISNGYKVAFKRTKNLKKKLKKNPKRVFWFKEFKLKKKIKNKKFKKFWFKNLTKKNIKITINDKLKHKKSLNFVKTAFKIVKKSVKIVSKFKKDKEKREKFKVKSKYVKRNLKEIQIQNLKDR